MQLILLTIVVTMSVFGGGPVFIPMYEDVFVNVLKVMDTEAYQSMVAIASTFPGPTPAKLIVGGAYEANILHIGIIAMVISTILPICMALIANKSIKKLQRNEVFNNTTKGIGAAVSGILLVAFISFMTIGTTTKEHIIVGVIFAISIAVITKTKTKPIFLILTSIICAVIYHYN